MARPAFILYLEFVPFLSVDSDTSPSKYHHEPIKFGQLLTGTHGRNVNDRIFYLDVNYINQIQEAKISVLQIFV